MPLRGYASNESRRCQWPLAECSHDNKQGRTTCTRSTVKPPSPATLDDLWDTWTDMAAYPSWDPREEELRIDGPFAGGHHRFLEAGRSAPRLDIRGDQGRADEPVDQRDPPPRRQAGDRPQAVPQTDGTVRLVKRYEAYGPMSVAFRLVFARGIRSEMPATFAALAQEAERRARA